MIRSILLIVAVWLIGIGAFAYNARAQSHHGHAENHDWYRLLKQPGTGASCGVARRRGQRVGARRGSHRAGAA